MSHKLMTPAISLKSHITLLVCPVWKHEGLLMTSYRSVQSEHYSCSSHISISSTNNYSPSSLHADTGHDPGSHPIWFYAWFIHPSLLCTAENAFINHVISVFGSQTSIISDLNHFFFFYIWPAGPTTVSDRMRYLPYWFANMFYLPVQQKRGKRERMRRMGCSTLKSMGVKLRGRKGRGCALICILSEFAGGFFRVISNNHSDNNNFPLTGSFDIWD